jgi:hypothetical protein
MTHVVESDPNEREDEEKCKTYAVKPRVPVQRGEIVRRNN